jgi:hypothetical protein
MWTTFLYLSWFLKKDERKYKCSKFETNILILFCGFFLCSCFSFCLFVVVFCCCCIILTLMTHLLVNNENCLFHFEKAAKRTIIGNVHIHVCEMLLCTFFYIFSFIFLIKIIAYSLQSNLTLLVLVVSKIKNASLLMSGYCIKETLLFKWGSAV